MKSPLLYLFTTLFLISSVAADQKFTSEGQRLRLQTLLEDRDVIWGFDFLSPTKIIYTLKSGKIKVASFTSKVITEIKGVPEVNLHGQGGLLDIRYYTPTKHLYFTYAKETTPGKYSTILARAKITQGSLTQIETLLITKAASPAGEHFGSRIEFQPPFLFMTVGDRGQRDLAQDLSTHNGKILRLTLDGKVPSDNPFTNQPEIQSAIWSYGHRNPQGLALRPGTTELWEAEFGPQGGDEINLISAGKNYGWPKITFGEEYGGGQIAPTAAAGLEQPLKYYTPSISPSAINFYSSDFLKEWKGNLFIANLSSQHLRRLVIENQKIIKDEKLLENLGLRFRNVRTSPDGRLFLSTDSGLILYITKDSLS